MVTNSTVTVRRADLFFAAKDQALREDVHQLGELVGELVREQAGEAVFDLVESARRAAIDHREGDSEALGVLTGLIGTLAPSTAEDFIRAFSTYFQMVNMAEKVHRIRRRRAYSRDASTPQPFGFVDILQRLKAAGIDADAVEGELATILVEPVFAASSAEATRRTLLRKQQNIARHLVRMLDPYMTPQELSATLGRIRVEMTTGWQTEEHPAERRTGDEAEHILFYLTDVLYRMIPPFYEDIESAFANVYPERGVRPRVPILIRFGSWVGGDMAGNSSITAKSIRETLVRQRALALDLYFKECRELAAQLSQSETRVGVSDEIRRRSELYGGHFTNALHSVPARHRTMPYRVFLRLIMARLQATYDDHAFPYESPEELIADIELIADSLRANKGRSAGLFSVQRLLRRLYTFGFHLAALDISQRASVHRRVIAEGLEEPRWTEMTSAERVERLGEALERRESPPMTLSSEARRTLAVFQAILHTRRKYGARAIGPYIVSGAEGPDDVLSVLLLARWGHLGPRGSAVPLDIAPLFESEEQLAAAPETLAALLGDAGYRRHLADRGDEQVVMLGYAPASRAAGVAASRWQLRKTQERLIEVAGELGVKLKLFHGAGSTLSRSGVRPHEAMLAAPSGAIAGQLRITERGESINARYGLRGIAIRSLEQIASAVLWLTVTPPARQAQESHWQMIMDEIAARGRERYQRLVQDLPDFLEYFDAATPADVIARLSLPTSPADADDDREVERTATEVPWDFAWAQSRCLLPEWFGTATALAHALEEFGEPALKEMYEEWYFFRVLVSDIEAALAKADLDIAERYSALAGPLHSKFFPTIRAEYDHCVELVLRITGHRRLLEADRTLRRAIRLRNPYVDPMSLLQIDLLERWRTGGRSDDAILQALFASVNGIAYGMQNIG